MKKILLLTILTMLLISKTYSQKIFTYGFKLGLNYSSAIIDSKFMSSSDFTSTSGLSGGAFLNINIIPFFGLNTGIEYIQKGFGSKGAINSVSIIKNETAHYISIPFTLQYSIVSIPKISPYLFLGPRYDYLLGYKDDNGFYKSFKENDFGGRIGFGVKADINLPFEPLFEINYDFDFANSFDEDVLKMKNSTINLMVGLSI